MSFILISHANEDKPRVRPLVEALVTEGEPVWIDRPGHGSGNLGLDQSYIAANGIDYLQSGNPWSTSILESVRRSGAVLGCLSRALKPHRDVILSELVTAATMGKLVTCLIDDIARDELGQFGTLDMRSIQSQSVDPLLLQSALDAQRARKYSVDELPPILRTEWEKVRHIIGHINRVRAEPRRLSEADIAVQAFRLRRIPIPPVLRITSVPEEIILALARHAGEPKRASALIQQANALSVAAESNADLAAKLVIRETALIPISSTSSESYWTKVFAHAGLIARRTVAAVMLTPVAAWAFQQARIEEIASLFVQDLENGSIQ